MRKTTAMLLVALCMLLAYYMGKYAGAEHVILNAQPFILEYVTEPADFCTIYIDYGEPYGIHEYTGFVG